MTHWCCLATAPASKLQHLADLNQNLPKVDQGESRIPHPDGIDPQHPVILGDMPEDVLAARGMLSPVV
jgi:hypothetical protein